MKWRLTILTLLSFVCLSGCQLKREDDDFLHHEPIKEQEEVTIDQVAKYWIDQLDQQMNLDSCYRSWYEISEDTVLFFVDYEGITDFAITLALFGTEQQQAQWETITDQLVQYSQLIQSDLNQAGFKEIDVYLCLSEEREEAVVAIAQNGNLTFDIVSGVGVEIPEMDAL